MSRNPRAHLHRKNSQRCSHQKKVHRKTHSLRIHKVSSPSRHSSLLPRARQIKIWRHFEMRRYRNIPCRKKAQTAVHRVLRTLQLEGLSKDQLAYARNEIYARHGRRFQDQMFQDYFNAKSWYVPQYDPDQFDAMQDTIFNEYEKANAKLILEVEQEHGYTY